MLLLKSQEGELVIDNSSIPSHAIPDTSLALTSAPSTSSPDTSLTSVHTSALYVTPDTSLTLSGPSPAVLGQESLHADTSLSNATYDFFGCFPPNPQDDESEDLDLNRTILPMPPNYTLPSPLPPSSPLLSSPTSSHSGQHHSLLFSPLTAASTIGRDISFMEALNNPDFGFIHGYGYNSDRMTPHNPMSPPHLHHFLSALTNAPSHYVPPTAISTPTHPPTPVLDTPSPEGIISADPTGPATVSPSPAPTSTPACPEGTMAIGVTSPATGMEASNHQSTMMNLEMVQAKCPKKWGAVVISTENSQLNEGGRGKQQCFQLSQATAANDIGMKK